LHLRHRQEGRHPPRRVRRQPSRPCRGSLRLGEKTAVLMQVGRDTVVSLKIQMYDAQGALLHAPEHEHVYLHGGYGGLLDALERSLEGKNPGESVRVQLEPEQAFGEYDADLVRVEPAERYGQGVAVGMEIEEDEHLYTVTDVGAGQGVLAG